MGNLWLNNLKKKAQYLYGKKVLFRICYQSCFHSISIYFNKIRKIFYLFVSFSTNHFDNFGQT